MVSRYLLAALCSIALAASVSVLMMGAAPNPIALHPISKVWRINGQVYALNWAGYAVPAREGTVTSVVGSFIVPSLSCSGQNTYVALWAGLDGYNDSTVEQAGVLGECYHGKAYYYVWYEFYPSPAVFLSNMTAAPGDRVYVNVTYIGGGEFKINITIVPVKGKAEESIIEGSEPSALLSSAECILERPEVNGHLSTLANFGTAYYGQDYTGLKNTCYATVSGVFAPFGSFSSVVEIIMVNYNGAVLAYPSQLTPDGSSFTVTYG